MRFVFFFFFLDRGGKRDKAANGGKNPVKKPTPPLQLRVEQGKFIVFVGILMLI